MSVPSLGGNLNPVAQEASVSQPVAVIEQPQPEPVKVENPPADPPDINATFASHTGIDPAIYRSLHEHKISQQSNEDYQNFDNGDLRQEHRRDSNVGGDQSQSDFGGGLGEADSSSNSNQSNSTSNSSQPKDNEKANQSNAGGSLNASSAGTVIPGAEQAISYAQNPPLNPYNRKSNDPENDGKWGLWCLGLVNQAYQSAGQTIPELGEGNAYLAYSAFANKGLIHRDDAIPPKGAIVFFDWISGSGERFGHVGISLGDGRYIGTTESGNPATEVKDIRPGKYLGWAYPNASKVTTQQISTNNGNDVAAPQLSSTRNNNSTVGGTIGNASNNGANGSGNSHLRIADQKINDKLFSMSDKKLAAWMSEQKPSQTFKGGSPVNRRDQNVHFKNFGADPSRPDAQIYTYQASDANGGAKWNSFVVSGSIAHAYNEMEPMAGTNSSMGLPTSDVQQNPNRFDGKPFQEFENATLVEIEPGVVQRFNKSGETVGKAYIDPRPSNLEPTGKSNTHGTVGGTIGNGNNLTDGRNITDGNTSLNPVENISTIESVKTVQTFSAIEAGDFTQLTARKSAVENARKKLDDAKVNENLGYDIARLAPGLTEAQKREYITRYRQASSEYGELRKAEDNLNKFLANSKNQASLKEFALKNPKAATELYDTLTTSAKNGGGREILAFADDLIKTAQENPSKLSEFQSINKTKLFGDIINNAFANIATDLLLISGRPEDAVNGFIDYLGKLDGVKDLYKDGREINPSFKDFSDFLKDIATGGRGKLPSLVSTIKDTGALGTGLLGVSLIFKSALAKDAIDNKQLEDIAKGFSEAGEDMFKVLSVISGSLSTKLDANSLAARGLGNLSKGLSAVTPVLSFVANTSSAIVHGMEIKKNPANAGAWIGLLGDTIGTIGSVMQMVPGGTLLGTPLSAIGGAVSSLGDLISTMVEIGEAENRQNRILSNIVDDTDLRKTLTYLAKYGHLEYIKFNLGLSAEHMQLLAKKHSNTIFKNVRDLDNFGSLVKTFGLSSLEVTALIERIGNSNSNLNPIAYVLQVLQSTPIKDVDTKEKWLEYLKNSPQSKIRPEFKALIGFLEEQNQPLRLVGNKPNRPAPSPV